jgi:hypothetical protein
MNLLATNRFNIFEINDRFKIGMYDVVSSRSRIDFFSHGQTGADFKSLGTVPSANDALHIITMTSASRGDSFLPATSGLDQVGSA